MTDPADEKSHIRAKVIIEVLGKPKEHIEKAIRDYIDKIQRDPNLILLNSSFSDTAQKGELWAVFCEIEIVIKGMHTLVAFCFEYMPSSVQIVKPDAFSLPAESIEDFINNLQSRLHDIDMVVKQLRNENHFLKKNMHMAVKNSILLTLSRSPMNADQLSKTTGIHKKELESFLRQIKDEGKIKEEREVFFLT